MKKVNGANRLEVGDRVEVEDHAGGLRSPRHKGLVVRLTEEDFTIKPLEGGPEVTIPAPPVAWEGWVSAYRIRVVKSVSHATLPELMRAL